MIEAEIKTDRKRVRDWGIQIGSMPTGPLNAISDVGGVRVGHVTIRRGDGREGPTLRTGVTAIVPHEGNVFRDKVPAATHVINGFGKSVGLPQINELGNMESPILLTSTLNVWRVADAMIDLLAQQNPDTHSFNVVVGECNDSYLNDALERPVGAEDVRRVLAQMRRGPVKEGCVGAGTGMSGFGYKAGIGTASRVVEHNAHSCVLGALVLMNTGRAGDFRVDGIPVPAGTSRSPQADSAGSIIIVLATDAGLSPRQLGRVARRASFGLARTGAYAGHGSGDFVVAFTTARSRGAAQWPDAQLDPLFRAAVEATEEAIVNSIFTATTTVGRGGRVRRALPPEIIRDVARRWRTARCIP